MPRRWFRKFLPQQSALERNRILRLFGLTLLNKRFWQLNRHSVAFGVACGVFWAWICAPVQTIGAVLSAMLGRGNVPLAMTATWLSNPITWGPCFWLSYEVGLLVTPAKRINGISDMVSSAMDGGIFSGMWTVLKFIGSNLDQLYPLYVGGIVLGGFTALFAYAGISLMWRWSVGLRWRRRHEEIRKANPHARVNSGFAHLHRRKPKVG